MAYKCVILGSAERELDEIIGFLVETVGNARAAATLLELMDHEMNLLSDFPTVHALSRIPEIAEKGYRAALLGNYVMLYRFEDDTVYVTHIFHQRQDYASYV